MPFVYVTLATLVTLEMAGIPRVYLEYVTMWVGASHQPIRTSVSETKEAVYRPMRGASWDENRLTSPWFTRSCMKTHEWTFAKVGATVHDNIFEVLIAGSLSYLYSWLPIALFYMHRGTSHIGSCWHVFLWRARLSFREHKRRNGEICPCSCSASKAMFY